MNLENLSFEEAFNKLEEIVAKLSSGKANLEETINYYEEALKLKTLCENKLEQAKLRVKILNENNVEQNFDVETS
jgi:exodeoxyribonuclease VII small subunit